METPAKPLRGIEIVRAMRERKKRIEQESIEAYRTNPEIRAIYDQLKKENSSTRDKQG